MNIQEYNEYVTGQWNRSGKGKERSDMEHLAIMSLGLPGEAGEVTEHVKKFIRDGRPVGDDFALECGDTLYYLVRLANRFGYTLQDIIDMNVQKLDERFGGRIIPLGRT